MQNDTLIRASSCSSESDSSSSLGRRSVVSENFAEYRSWKGARNRCNNPKNPQYHRYGGRGIYFSSEWSSFERFLSDMGKKPSPSHSLDRINNEGPYAPENCRWATKREQSNNVRTNRLLEYQGEIKSVAQWARDLNLCVETLEWRLANNWTIESALSIPTLPKGKSGKKRIGERTP